MGIDYDGALSFHIFSTGIDTRTLDSGLKKLTQEFKRAGFKKIFNPDEVELFNSMYEAMLKFKADCRLEFGSQTKSEETTLTEFNQILTEISDE